MDLLDRLLDNARRRDRKIVLPEGDDPRIVAAAARLKAEKPKVTVLQPPAGMGGNGDTAEGLLGFILQGIFWGAVSLITPCVFPMIPITVSFFLKKSEKEHHRPLLTSPQGDFEGYVSWGVGLQRAACYRVFELSNPPRLVVDVQNDGPTPVDPPSRPAPSTAVAASPWAARVRPRSVSWSTSAPAAIPSSTAS